MRATRICQGRVEDAAERTPNGEDRSGSWGRRSAYPARSGLTHYKPGIPPFTALPLSPEPAQKAIPRPTSMRRLRAALRSCSATIRGSNSRSDAMGPGAPQNAPGLSLWVCWLSQEPVLVSGACQACNGCKHALHNLVAVDFGELVVLRSPQRNTAVSSSRRLEPRSAVMTGIWSWRTEVRSSEDQASAQPSGKAPPVCGFYVAGSFSHVRGACCRQERPER